MSRRGKTVWTTAGFHELPEATRRGLSSDFVGLTVLGTGYLLLKLLSEPAIEILAVEFGSLAYLPEILVLVAAAGGWAWRRSRPRIRLALDRQRLAPGEPFELGWSIERGADRLRELNLSLRAGRYQRLDLESDKWHLIEDVGVWTLASLSAPVPIDGTLSNAIPTTALGDRYSRSSRVAWTVLAEGRSRFRPRLQSEFRVYVPSEVEPSASGRGDS